MILFNNYIGKLKFMIKNHRITTKTEFLGPTHKLFGEKNLEQFWSIFAPTKISICRILPGDPLSLDHFMQN